MQDNKFIGFMDIAPSNCVFRVDNPAIMLCYTARLPDEHDAMLE